MSSCNLYENRSLYVQSMMYVKVNYNQVALKFPMGKVLASNKPFAELISRCTTDRNGDNKIPKLGCIQLHCLLVDETEPDENNEDAPKPDECGAIIKDRTVVINCICPGYSCYVDPSVDTGALKTPVSRRVSEIDCFDVKTKTYKRKDLCHVTYAYKNAHDLQSVEPELIFDNNIDDITAFTINKNNRFLCGKCKSVKVDSLCIPCKGFRCFDCHNHDDTHCSIVRYTKYILITQKLIKCTTPLTTKVGSVLAEYVTFEHPSNLDWGDTVQHEVHMNDKTVQFFF